VANFGVKIWGYSQAGLEESFPSIPRKSYSENIVLRGGGAGSWEVLTFLVTFYWVIQMTYDLQQLRGSETMGIALAKFCFRYFQKAEEAPARVTVP
jgi:hypothetical protein